MPYLNAALVPNHCVQSLIIIYRPRQTCLGQAAGRGSISWLVTALKTWMAGKAEDGAGTWYKFSDW